ncbi:MAG: hypothetical protein Q4E28_02630 [Clostridia bacterium]|nr:hypothetical protein [Clostridia bacterium]
MFENQNLNEEENNFGNFSIHDLNPDDLNVLSGDDMEDAEFVRKTKHYKTVSISDELNNPMILNVVKNHSANAENLISLKTAKGTGLVFEFSEIENRTADTLIKVYSLISDTAPAMIPPESSKEEALQKGKKFIEHTAEFNDFLS